MTLEINQKIDGRYKIIEHLGQGGMGTVWKALDQQLGDEVVIKMPLENSDPIVLQRFGTEALTMRQHSLDNPNILDIQGLGDVDGTPYYVMRYLPGGSLEDRRPMLDQNGGPDFRPQSYEWLLAIGKALDFLHSKDVLHRDVKPANILFNNSGDAYLADFGIVKTPLEATNFTSAPTAPNTSPGTIEYMPPEVLSGSADLISGAGDQYALAVTLYEMINGARPFTGPTETAIYMAINNGATPLSEVKPGIPIPVAASDVVSRALAADPSQRFVTCREFAQSFLQALVSASTPTPIPQPAAPQDKEVPVPPEDSDGTRELDLEKYKREKEKQEKGLSSAGRDGSDFRPPPGFGTGPAKPPKVPTKPSTTGKKTGLILVGCIGLLGLVGAILYATGMLGGAAPYGAPEINAERRLKIEEGLQPDLSGVDHAVWDYLLKSYVTNGLVDYPAIKKDHLFRKYLRDLGACDPELLDTEDARLALACNAYNAFVINGVVSHHILDTVNEFEIDGMAFFDLKEHIFASQTISLNDLEHEMIRHTFKEPRIHVALLSTGRSCPSIRAEAYTAERVRNQLQDQSVQFANDPKYVMYDPVTQELKLSKILDWYRDDWNERYPNGSYLAWINELTDDAAVKDATLRAFDGEVKVSFFEYDWALNSQADPEAGPPEKTKPGGFGSGSRPDGGQGFGSGSRPDE